MVRPRTRLKSTAYVCAACHFPSCSRAPRVATGSLPAAALHPLAFLSASQIHPTTACVMSAPASSSRLLLAVDCQVASFIPHPPSPSPSPFPFPTSHPTCPRHPDKNADNADEATERFKEVSAAYARLTKAEESDDDLDDIDIDDLFADFEDLFGAAGIDPMFILLSQVSVQVGGGVGGWVRGC